MVTGSHEALGNNSDSNSQPPPTLCVILGPWSGGPGNSEKVVFEETLGGLLAVGWRQYYNHTAAFIVFTVHRVFCMNHLTASL